jgi:hypothetical protein
MSQHQKPKNRKVTKSSPRVLIASFLTFISFLFYYDIYLQTIISFVDYMCTKDIDLIKHLKSSNDNTICYLICKSYVERWYLWLVSLFPNDDFFMFPMEYPFCLFETTKRWFFSRKLSGFLVYNYLKKWNGGRLLLSPVSIYILYVYLVVWILN